MPEGTSEKWRESTLSRQRGGGGGATALPTRRLSENSIFRKILIFNSLKNIKLIFLKIGDFAILGQSPRRN